VENTHHGAQLHLTEKERERRRKEVDLRSYHKDRFIK
jgi:hypothetical protein